MAEALAQPWLVLMRIQPDVLPRTRSAVRGKTIVIEIQPPRDPDDFTGGRAPTPTPPPVLGASEQLPERETFEILVEAGAERLNLLLSTRDDAVSAWGPGFALTGPNGETVSHGDPAVISDSFYRLIRVPEPAAGTWRLEVFALGPNDQFSYLLGHVENDAPDCYASAFPRILRGDLGQGILLGGVASFGRPLGAGVTYTARVTRPDGSTVTLDLPLTDQLNGAEARFSQFVGRGLYNVELTCAVGEDARFAPGERATPDDIAAQGLPAAFVRTATTGFFLDVAQTPPLPPGDDCDQDGLSNSEEGEADTDGDGVVDACDGDSDGDDVPDSQEEPGDADGDGKPNYQDPDSDNDGLPDGLDDAPYTARDFEYHYAAKLLCGEASRGSVPDLVEGRYATVINVMNPNRNPVEFEKSLSLALPPGSQRPGQVMPIARDRLLPNQSLAIDCTDIQNRLFPSGLPGPYIDGYLVLQSPKSLEVTAVYSTTGGEREQGEGCCKPAVVTGSPGLDVERVPERRIPIEQPKPRADLVPLPALPIDGQEGFAGFFYCMKDPQTIAARRIRVRVRNQGAGPSGPSATRVEFEDVGVATAPTGTLADNAEAFHTFDIPDGCYGGEGSSCKFRIIVDAPPSSVTEADETNNVDESFCLAPIH